MHHFFTRKFIQLLILLVVTSLFGWASFVSAVDFRQDLEVQANGFLGARGMGYTSSPVDPRLVVANLIQYALAVIGTIFLGYGVYAGYKIMTAQGDEDKVSIGKDTLRRSIIGILIILSAYAITVLVTNMYAYTFERPDNYIDFDVDVVPYDNYGNPDPLAL